MTCDFYIVRSLPFINAKVSPFFEITFIFAYISGFILFWNLSGINSLILGLITHITALHESIIISLGEIKSPGYLSKSDEAENLRKLKACVEKQANLLRSVLAHVKKKSDALVGHVSIFDTLRTRE
jgi:hypothetical protein